MDNYVQHCLEEEIEDLKERIVSLQEDSTSDPRWISDLKSQLASKRDQLDLLLNKTSDFNRWL